MFPNGYPWTDFHKMNMDWILKTIKELVDEMNNFTKLNVIKIADPFNWNINNEYEGNTIVFDDVNKIGYLSKKAVPAGSILLSNTDYWEKILDLSIYYDAIGTLDDLKSIIKTNLVNAINSVIDNLPYLTPEYFGAVGDGVTDDTNALKACLSACKVHGIVKLPNRYKISETLEITKPMTIDGCYSGFDIEENTDNVTNAEYQECTITTSAGAFKIQSVGVTITNIGIYSIGPEDVIVFTSLADVNSNTQTPRNCTVRNVTIWANSGYITNGISAPGDLITSTFEQVRIYGTTNGFNIGSSTRSSTSLNFLNCWVINCIGSAYKLQYASYVTFSGCSCDNSNATMQVGYDLSYCNTVSIIGCGVEGTYLAGIELTECVGVFVNLFGYRVNDSASADGGFCVTHGSSFELNGCKVAPIEPASHCLIAINDNLIQRSKYTIKNCEYKYISSNGIDYVCENKDFNGIFKISSQYLTGNNGEVLTDFPVDKYGLLSVCLPNVSNDQVTPYVANSKWGFHVTSLWGADETNTTVDVDLVFIDYNYVNNVLR